MYFICEGIFVPGNRILQGTVFWILTLGQPHKQLFSTFMELGLMARFSVTNQDHLHACLHKIKFI